MDLKYNIIYNYNMYVCVCVWTVNYLYIINVIFIIYS